MSAPRRLLPLLAALSLCAAFAAAQDDGPPTDSPPQGPCAHDSQTLCPGLHPGDGKFGPCMKEQAQAGKLSPKCKAMVERIMNLAGEDQGDDEDNDAASEETPPKPDGKTKAKAPAKIDKDDQDPPPDDAQGSDHPAAKPAPDCRDKIQKLCPGLRPGDGKFGPCLMQHRKELTGCRKPPPPPPDDENDDEGDSD